MMFLKNELNRIELRLVVDFFVNPSSRTQTRVEMFESLTKWITKEIIFLSSRYLWPLWFE